MKLLVDMNLSPRWVEVLSGAGVQAVHWSTLGAKNATDFEIMAYAGANDYVVIGHCQTDCGDDDPQRLESTGSTGYQSVPERHQGLRR